MKQSKRDFFWASYVDLMTVLFVVMLILFVLSFTLFQNEKSRLKVMVKQYEKIIEIETSLSKLKDDYFEFQPKYKRHVLKKQVQFKLGDDKIPEDNYEELIGAGKEINRMIEEVRKKDKNIKYLLIIEGSSSKTGNNYENYLLSYRRALALYDLWKKNDVNFQSEVCEIQIAGNGTEGVGRIDSDDKLNQRFLIQIIPKIGSLKVN
ncbi:MAG: hypothetical protein EAZ85_03065 [Bacteroidetes bacterium]|nr:MAG: hypothetical protein EAZ85_03065 [Bacteroidota bacterium]